MATRLIEARGHTTRDGMLQLNMDLGVPDADVTVLVRVMPAPSTSTDVNGWPEGFFETIAGSMPDLERAPQGDFEERTPQP
jgi:hypothetical protein